MIFLYYEILPFSLQPPFPPPLYPFLENIPFMCMWWRMTPTPPY